MLEFKREDQILRIVLVDEVSEAPEDVVSKLKRALAEEGVEEVVIQLPAEAAAPARHATAEVILELTEETLAHGVPLRFTQ